MRILLESNHHYPAGGVHSTGLRPNPLATGGASIVHDLLAKGLAELGHEVYYLLPHSTNPELPPGVRHLTEPLTQVDIFHHYNSQKLKESLALPIIEASGIPWLVSCHNDPRHWGAPLSMVADNWVSVSQSLARSLGRDRFVHNGIDPATLCYSTDKQDYGLFMSNMISMEQVHHKGLDIALNLAQEAGFALRVVGSFRDAAIYGQVAEMCRKAGAEFLGDVRGPEKAALLAHARVLLFPTRINESFGLVIAEALMSGTAVICSDRGACRELVGPGTGFVCSDQAAYLEAIGRLPEIEPLCCRRWAMEKFDYRLMAQAFVAQYQQEIHCRNGVTCS